MRKVFLFALLLCYITVITAANPGYLGISIRDFLNKDIKGVQVMNIFDDGAAKQYGIKENDIITAINGISVVKKSDLTNELAHYNWTDKVHLDYIRNGEKSSADIFLGYKKTTRTYNVKKESKSDGEHWLFADDNTDVIVNKNNEVISISKKDKDGKVEIWTPQNIYNDVEVPQYFLDAEDKMYCIKRIKEEQSKRNSKANEIVFIKELTEKKKENNSMELMLEIFSVVPNPSNGNFLLTVKSNEKGTAQINIFDISGRIVTSASVIDFDHSFSKSFNLESEPKGIYLIQLNIAGKLINKQLILQ